MAIVSCTCGRRFDPTSSGYTNHLRHCKQHQEKVRKTSAAARQAIRDKSRRARHAEAQAEELRHPISAAGLQEPEVFHDYLPRIPGLQSATTGQRRPLASPPAELPPQLPSPTAEAPVQQVDAPSTSRPKRSAASRRLPKRFRDQLPEGPTPLPPPLAPTTTTVNPQVEPPSTNSAPVPSDGGLIEARPMPIFRTQPNAFGVYREYARQPLRIPDADIPLEALSANPPPPPLRAVHPLNGDQGSIAGPTIKNRGAATLDADALQRAIYPCRNLSTFRLLEWFHCTSGERMSRVALKSLIDNVIRADDFSPKDFDNFSLQRMELGLDNLNNEDLDNPLQFSDDWVEETLKIDVPIKSSADAQSTPNSKPLPVKGFLHRQLIPVIKAALQDESAASFHFEPFKSQRVRADPDGPERLYDELYASDMWLQEHEKIQNSPPVPGCNLPRAIAGLMFWSDATHVSQFGQAKMWPIYLFLGNQSKWDRCRPQTHSAHHVGHIPSLPDDIQDFIRASTNGKSGSAPLLTHCRRELIHAVWAAMLDAEFLDAYRHGVVVKCADGITRRIYPRIFTYSADYPEKVLIATIRDLGDCPCPRCLVGKDKISLLGKPSDRQIRVEKVRVDDDARRRKVISARKIIYKHGRAVNHENVEYFLKDESLVPTVNAFSVLNVEFGFDIFSTLAVDLMHEFELGVWKAVFTHLVRILHSVKRVDEFNARFRQIGNFGKATIRSFRSVNVTDMKNFAARTFEDVLQCIIPCFEDLVPEPHNSNITSFLFILTLWLSLAKLRMHTDRTLNHLDHTTTALGDHIRLFASKTCGAFETFETPSEVGARMRRTNRKQSGTAATLKLPKGKDSGRAPGRRHKVFSLRTYKLHALGDYVPTIRWGGTTDSYSTQIGELEHRSVKSYYRRGSKKTTSYVREAAKAHRRQILLRRKTAEVKSLGVNMGKQLHNLTRSNSSRLPPTPLEDHHHIGSTQDHWIHIGDFVNGNPLEPALDSFIPRLQNHLLGRLHAREFDGEEHDFPMSEREEVIIVNNRIYQHGYLRCNYMTYDVRRDQDVINPRIPSRSFIMVPSAAGDHPFWYARVLGVFHTRVLHRPLGISSPRRMEFLWVRWMGDEPGLSTGFSNKRLHMIGYVPAQDGAFGFLDPSLVVRGCHVIPAFKFGKTKTLLAKSMFWDDPLEGDFTNYYVNPFVDRDMLMRHLGGAVGHASQSFANGDSGLHGNLDVSAAASTDDDNDAAENNNTNRAFPGTDHEPALDVSRETDNTDDDSQDDEDDADNDDGNEEDDDEDNEGPGGGGNEDFSPESDGELDIDEAEEAEEVDYYQY